MNTKKVDSVFEAAHCLYASPMNIIGDGYFMGDLKKVSNVSLYVIKNSIEVLDIDEEWEFKSFESIYKNIKKKNQMNIEKVLLEKHIMIIEKELNLNILNMQN